MLTQLEQKALVLVLLKFGMMVERDVFGRPVFDFSQMDKESFVLRGERETHRAYKMLQGEYPESDNHPVSRQECRFLKRI